MNVDILATFSEMDPHGSDGINWYIEQGATPLASGSIPGGGDPQSWGTSLPVKKGDFLYFIVDPAYTLHFDSTRLDLTIRRVKDSLFKRIKTMYSPESLSPPMPI